MAMLSPYDRALQEFQAALADIDGDGVPDAAPSNLMAQLQQNPRGWGSMPPIAEPRGELRQSPSTMDRVASYGPSVRNFLAEMTGVPGVMRGTERILSNSTDPTGSPFEVARGAGEVALGVIPGVMAAGKAAGPVYNALMGTPSRAVGSVVAPMGAIGAADVAQASTGARDRRSRYIDDDPEVRRLRADVQRAEEAARIAGGGGLSQPDQVRLKQIQVQMDQISAQIARTTERREAKRPLSGAPDRKKDPIFFGAQDELDKLETQRTKLEGDIARIQEGARPNPTAITESTSALNRVRADLDAASSAADQGYRRDAPAKELYPELIAGAQAAGLALPALVGMRFGQMDRLARNSAASNLDRATAAATANRTDQTVRNALAARTEYDKVAKEGSGVVDTLKGIGSIIVPTSYRDAAIAGGATVPFAAPTVLDLSRPKDTRAYTEGRQDVTDPAWIASKMAILATANAGNKFGQGLGAAGPRTNPDLGPTTAMRAEYGINQQRDGLGVDMARINQATAEAQIGQFTAQEQAAIAEARLRNPTMQVASDRSDPPTVSPPVGLPRSDVPADRGASQRGGTAPEPPTPAKSQRPVRSRAQAESRLAEKTERTSLPPEYSAVAGSYIDDLIQHWRSEGLSPREIARRLESPSHIEQTARNVNDELLAAGLAPLSQKEMEMRILGSAKAFANESGDKRGRVKNALTIMTGKRGTLAVPLAVGAGGFASQYVDSPRNALMDP